MLVVFEFLLNEKEILTATTHRIFSSYLLSFHKLEYRKLHELRVHLITPRPWELDSEGCDTYITISSPSHIWHFRIYQHVRRSALFGYLKPRSCTHPTMCISHRFAIIAATIVVPSIFLARSIFIMTNVGCRLFIHDYRDFCPRSRKSSNTKHVSQVCSYRLSPQSYLTNTHHVHSL